jgi:hypothetical protein
MEDQPSKALSAAESALRIVRAIPDAMFRVSADGTILDYIPSSMKLLGDVREQLIGKPVDEIARFSGGIISDSLVNECSRFVQLAIEHQKPQSIEIQLESSAWPLWLELRAVPDEASGDDAVVIVREISEERRQRMYRQDRINETHALLTRLYQERKEEQSQLAQKLAELSGGVAELSGGGGDVSAKLEALLVELQEGVKIASDELAGQIEKTIEQVCGENSRLTSNVRMELSPQHLDAEIATGVFFIAREALHCVARHTGADRVRVSLVNTAEMLSLMISDNGPEEASQNENRAICLAKMRYQAEQLGGTFRITPGRRGTALRLRLPLADGKTDGQPPSEDDA